MASGAEIHQQIFADNMSILDSRPVFDKSFEVGSSDTYPPDIQQTQHRIFENHLSLLDSNPELQRYSAEYYTTAYVDIHHERQPPSSDEYLSRHPPEDSGSFERGDARH